MHRKVALGYKGACAPQFALASRCSACSPRRRAGAAAGSDGRDPRRSLGRCATRRRFLCRSGRHQAGHLFPAADTRRRDGGRDHRLHDAEPRLAQPGAAGTPAPGSDRRRTGSGIGPGTMPSRQADSAASAAALRRGRSQRRDTTPTQPSEARARLDLPASPTRQPRPPFFTAGPARCSPTISGIASSISPGMTQRRPHARSQRLDPAHRAAAEVLAALQRQCAQCRNAARRPAGRRASRSGRHAGPCALAAACGPHGRCSGAVAARRRRGAARCAAG